VNSVNYYGMSVVGTIDGTGAMHATPGLTMQQAYAMDTKIDDGFPQTGRAIAKYLDWTITHGGPVWAAGGGVAGASSTGITAGSATTCYDNSANSSGTPGLANATQHYSLEMGNYVNCALLFTFQ